MTQRKTKGICLTRDAGGRVVIGRLQQEGSQSDATHAPHTTCTDGDSGREPERDSAGPVDNV